MWVLGEGREKRKVGKGFQNSDLLSKCKTDRPYCALNGRKSAKGKQDAAELMLGCRGGS